MVTPGTDPETRIRPHSIAGHDHRKERASTRRMDQDNVNGYQIPVDPMELLQCDSCQ